MSKSRDSAVRGAYLRPAFATPRSPTRSRPASSAALPHAPLETVAELTATHNVHAVAVGVLTDDQLAWRVIELLDVNRALHYGGRIAQPFARQDAGDGSAVWCSSTPRANDMPDIADRLGEPIRTVEQNLEGAV